MAIDAQTGVITWTPTLAQVGLQTVVVAAKDNRGGTTTQNFNPTLVSALVNQAPDFTSNPQTNATVGQFYQYAVSATDPDNDALISDLVVKPDGMVIDPISGEILWTPKSAQVGAHSVIARVWDGQGGITQQAFDVVVQQPNTEPIITSTLPVQATAGRPLHYQLKADDAQGRPLTYRLDTFPQGAAIDGSGVVTWTPQASQAACAA